MAKSRALIHVHGRVQGVGYRGMCEFFANQLGLKGLAKNLSDGRVEVILEGEKENIEKFLEAIKKPTWPAKVEKIDVKWEEFKKQFKEFRW